jgi:hypothetical protein
MNGQPLNIPVNVAPGQTVDLSITLIAPKEPLTYQGFWQIENDKGERLGQTIWVAISTLADQDNPIATGQPSGSYCVVTVTAPRNSIPVLSDFDAIWALRNISGNNWRTDSVDFKLISGTKMHKKDGYDFTQTIIMEKVDKSQWIWLPQANMACIPAHGQSSLAVEPFASFM